MRSRIFYRDGESNRWKRWLVAVLVAGGWAASAVAADLAQRLYAEAEMGIAWRDLDGPLLASGGIAPGSQVRFRDGSTRAHPYGAGFVGVRINEWLSFRGGYQDFGHTEVTVQRPIGYRAGYDLPADFHFRDTAFTFDPVLTWRVGPRVRLEGYWGIAFNRTDVTIQNYRPRPLDLGVVNIVVAGSPVSPVVSTPTYPEVALPGERTLTHLSRAGVAATIAVTDRLDFKVGFDRQRLSSLAKEAWMVHAGVAYSFDESHWLRDRFYVSAAAGAIWRKLDGPLLVQPGIYPGGSSEYRKGSATRSVYSAMNIGAKITEWLALEAGYQDFGTTNVLIREPPGFGSIPEYFPPGIFRSRDSAFTLDPVFTWKARPGLSLQAFWGLVFNRSDVVCENQNFYAAYSGYFGAARLGYRANSSRTTQSRLGVGAVAQILPGLELKLGVDYQKFSSFSSSAWMTHAGIVLGF